MAREARGLAVVNSSSGSKLWIRQEALEAAVSSGGGSELWGQQRDGRGLISGRIKNIVYDEMFW